MALPQNPIHYLPHSGIALEMDFSTVWFFSMLAFYGNNKHNNTRFSMFNEKNHLLSLAAKCVLVIMTLFMLSTLL